MCFKYLLFTGGGHLGRSLLSDDSHSPGFEPVNHYEKSSILLNRRAGPGGDMLGGANTVYHMGTISRASKMNNADKNQQVDSLRPSFALQH